MLLQEVNQLVSAAEAEQAQLAAELAALQARWAAREPRPEDVAAIAGQLVVGTSLLPCIRLDILAFYVMHVFTHHASAQHITGFLVSWQCCQHAIIDKQPQ